MSPTESAAPTVDVAGVGQCLHDGGIVLLPTDTVYGLAVHPERPDAIAKLFALKRRPGGINLPIMVADVEDIPALGVEITPAARRLLDVFAPGPLTVALGVRPGAAPAWLADRAEVGVRVPTDPVLVQVLRLTGPLLVTSANTHAAATPESAAGVLASLDGAPDLVVDGGVRAVVPSTLVNCNLPEPVIERHGVLSAEAIAAVLR